MQEQELLRGLQHALKQDCNLYRIYTKTQMIKNMLETLLYKV